MLKSFNLPQSIPPCPRLHRLKFTNYKTGRLLLTRRSESFFYPGFVQVHWLKSGFKKKILTPLKTATVPYMIILALFEENGVVLVHCAQGKSRSVTLCCAYICSLTLVDWKSALNGKISKKT